MSTPRLAETLADDRPRHERIAEALAHRARNSPPIFVAVGVVLLASTSYVRAYPGLSALALASIVAVAAIRYAQIVHTLRHRGRVPAIERSLPTLLAALAWGAWAGLAFTVATGPDALVVLVCTAGIASGCPSTLSPNRPLLIAYISIILAPVVVAALATGSLGLAVTVVLYAAFLVMQGRTHAREYDAARDQADLLAAYARDLEAAREQADGASRAKSEFLANMSHEIRTPMTAILGYADVLAKDEGTPAERAERVRVIQRSGRHLLGILNDILDVSKIEAGRLTVERRTCDLREVLRDAAEVVDRRASEKGLALEVTWSETAPRWVLGDAMRLRQILVNLLGNAVKFTERGAVRVIVGRREARICVDVADTGVGIDPSAVDRLFEPFSQVDASATRRHEGTGLGLVIARRLARILGGDVEVKSALGAGSTFTLWLPESATAAAPSSRPPAPAERASATMRARTTLDGVRVLVADDAPEIRRLLAHFLKQRGAEVDLAEDGELAFERAEAARVIGAPYDVVLMDMQMPRLDGYGATSRLRQRGYRAPILALTAHALDEERGRCVAAGCDDHLTKPIDAATLVAAVSRYARAS